jgi:phage repressor protein C with HTH and peptisase S24 domain
VSISDTNNSHLATNADMDQPEPDSTGLDLVAIAGRCRQMLSELGVHATVFAQEVGIPYSTFRAYLSAGRPPSPEFLAGVYRKHGYLPSWLLTGDQPAKKGQLSHDATADAFIVIPLLPITASAGNGTVNEELGEYNVAGLSFSRDWINQRRLKPANLRVIVVRGSSMDGVLSHGDRVLIDLSDTKPQSGFVYVLRQGDELLVKYCQLLPDGVLRVSSANQQFAAYDVDLAKNPGVAIVGRVVASMHEW